MKPKRKRGYLYLLLVLLLAGFIIFTSTNSGSSHSSLGGTIIAWVNTYIFQGSLTSGEQSAIVEASAKLFGHFSLYLLDGLFLYLYLNETKLNRKKALCVYAFFGLALSIAGETVQIFSKGRTPSAIDVMIDYTGFLLPAVFTLLRKHAY